MGALGADRSGGYLSWYADTDDGGNADFGLPDRQYKFRVDWEGSQYWTDPITIIPHEVNEIDMDLDLMGLDLIGSQLNLVSYNITLTLLPKL